MRVALFAFAPFLVVPLFAACGEDDERSCTLAACVGLIRLPLVTASGQPAAARGEFRQGRTNEVATRFDCDADSAAQPCAGGVISLLDVVGSVFEIRFQRPDNSFTDWQVVDLRLETVTDPDFNGPGCSCSWYEGDPEPVVVPAEALAAGG